MSPYHDEVVVVHAPLLAIRTVPTNALGERVRLRALPEDDEGVRFPLLGRL